MNEISLEKIFNFLEFQLTTDEWGKIEVSAKDFERGVSFTIDGALYISSLSFWPNGLGDIDSIEVASEKSDFKHYEFSSNEEALGTILQELRALIAKNEVA